MAERDREISRTDSGASSRDEAIPGVEPNRAANRRAAVEPDDTRTIPLREEELVAQRENRQVGEVVVRKVVEHAPARLEVDAVSEEVEIRHVPVGTAVDSRREPWQDGDTYVLPVYEEQLVVVKRLVLKEEVRVRRLANAEKRLFEETVTRERPIVEDSTPNGATREHFVDQAEGNRGLDAKRDEPDHEGPLERLARKLLD